MLHTILLIGYIVGDFLWSSSISKRVKNLETHSNNLQNILMRNEELENLSRIGHQKQLEDLNIQLNKLYEDLDRTIGSIDSIQEKIAELEVSTQNIANRLR